MAGNESTAALAGFESVPENFKGAITERDRKRQVALVRQFTEANVDIGEPEDMARREAACASLPVFLRTYFPEDFSEAFDENAREVLRLAEQVTDPATGGRFVCCMPRGSGKTLMLSRASLWAALSGRRQFVVILAASGGSASRLLAILAADIASNPRLLADFPEVCEPFRVAGGQAIRLRGLRHKGEPLNAASALDRLVFPTTEAGGGAAKGQVIVARGLTGAMRGITHALPGGKNIRPDLVLVDDPQTDKSAQSERQTREREELLSGAVMGLAGPTVRISVLVAATVIAKDDLAERLLHHHPEFVSRHFRLVERWADSKLWERYDELWKTQGAAMAGRLYAENRGEMDAGAIVPCTWRIRPGELSALQTARNLRLEMGDAAFAAEMQGEPPTASVGVYDLTPEKIISTTLPLAPWEVPAESKVVTAHCDINRTGLHWVATAFANDMSGHVAAYGNIAQNGELWPENAPEFVVARNIVTGLRQLVSTLAQAVFRRAGQGMRLSVLLIDAGFASELVHRFCLSVRVPFTLLPAIGRASGRYGWNRSTIVGAPAEHAHVQRTEKHANPYVMFDADHWRAVSQRALLGLPGEPGTLTLFEVKNKAAHKEFAEHVAAEKLVQTYETDHGLRYEWRHRPGSAWDWGDALTGTYAAAAISSARLCSSGTPAPPPRARPRPRIRLAKI